MRPRSGAFSTGEPIVTHNSSATRLCHACLPCSFEGGITTAAPPIIAIQVGIGQTRKQFHQIRVGLARWLTRSHRAIDGSMQRRQHGIKLPCVHREGRRRAHTLPLSPDGRGRGRDNTQPRQTHNSRNSLFTHIHHPRTFPNLAERVLDRKETTAAISAAAAVHGIKGAASQC